jgi:hypothetical protein
MADDARECECLQLERATGAAMKGPASAKTGPPSGGSAGPEAGAAARIGYNTPLRSIRARRLVGVGVERSPKCDAASTTS